MKVAYFSQFNCYDKTAWSGTIFSMVTSLEKQGAEFTFLGDHCRPPKKGAKGSVWRYKVLRTAKEKFFFNSSNQRGEKLFDFKSFASSAHEVLKDKKHDVIFAPAASRALSCLLDAGKIDTPIVYSSDATFQGLLKLYRPSLTPGEIRSREGFEASALSHAARVVYPSSWPIDSAVKEYNVPREKIVVVPYGANINHLPTLEAVKSKLKQDFSCRLLFIGKDWERKGGSIAIECFQYLKNLNHNVELSIIGSKPDLGFQDNRIKIFPFLNMNLERDRKIFIDTLLNAHFLLFPTRAEAFGVVSCEANAYGVPVIAANVGGVSSAVKDGINGHLLPLSANGEDYGNVILKYLTKKGIRREVYEPLMLSARAEYDERLNWDAWGARMFQVMREILT